MKAKLQFLKDLSTRKAAAAGTGLTSLAVTGMVWAQDATGVDTTAVQGSIESATQQGQTVGGYVIAAVAGMAVVGLIIGVVRKM